MGKAVLAVAQSAHSALDPDLLRIFITFYFCLFLLLYAIIAIIVIVIVRALPLILMWFLLPSHLLCFRLRSSGLNYRQMLVSGKGKLFVCFVSVCVRAVFKRLLLAYTCTTFVVLKVRFLAAHFIYNLLPFVNAVVVITFSYTSLSL